MVDDQLLQDLRQSFHESRFLGLLGAQLASVAPGVSEVVLDIQPHLTNRRGTAHGGGLATLIDSALSQAIRTMIPPGTGSATVEMKINYMSPGAPGRLTARGRVIHVGGSLATAQAEVSDAENTIVAVGLGTFRLFRNRPKQRECEQRNEEDARVCDD